MHRRKALVFVLVGLALAPVATVASAQPRSSHVRIHDNAADADPADLLARQLRRARGRSELQQLTQEILRDPEKFGLKVPPKGLSPEALNDPQIRKLIEQVLQERPSANPPLRLSEEQKQRLKEAYEKLPPLPGLSGPKPVQPPTSGPLPPQVRD